MNSPQNPQPHDQADGHRDAIAAARAGTPAADNARSYLRSLQQILEFKRGRLQMSLGAETAAEIETLLGKAIADLDTQTVARREVVSLVARRAAPDPALATMLQDMERTNRELGLTGDALVAEMEAGR